MIGATAVSIKPRGITMYGLDLIAAHMVGDFILQTDHMARNKFQDWKIRIFHVSIYALPADVLLRGKPG